MTQLNQIVTLSGNLLSGQVGWPHIASGAVRSGQLATTGTPDGTKFLRDDFTWAAAGGGLTSGVVSSGYVASGAVQGFFGSTRNIASGTVGVFDFGSGAVPAGAVGSGAVGSGNIGSGQIGHFHVGSGQFDGFELGSGAIVSGRMASGQIGHGHYANASVQSGDVASGVLFAGHLQSGTILAGAGIGVAVALGGITLTNLSGGALASGAVGSGVVASGSVQGFFGTTRNVASGTIGVFDFGSGAVVVGSVGSGAIQSGNVASGQVGFGHLADGSVQSGTVASGRLFAGHLQSGTILAGAGIGVSVALGGITLTNLSGGATVPASGTVGSGVVASGVVQGFFGSTRNIASGTVGVFDLGSGGIVAGTVGSGAVVSGNLASGQVGTFHIADAAVIAAKMASGSVLSGAVASGQIGNAHLANYAVTSGANASGSTMGSLLSGLTRHIASGTVGPFDLASGTIFAGAGIGVTIAASGITVTNLSGGAAGGSVDQGVCEIRLSLNSELAVNVSGDAIYTLCTSGRTTSGSAQLFIGSGFVSGICPGMVVVGASIPTGSFVTSVSGQTSIGMNNAATAATSGVSIEFIPAAIYAMPFGGNNVALYNGASWSMYAWASGLGSRILTYDNRQAGSTVNGSAVVSGLTDTFQLIPGMLAVMSGQIASGTVISTVDTAGTVTLNANAVSGTVAGSGSILFMLPPTSGGLSSGANWDIFAALRSGVPWLQFGSQWTSGNSRFDPLTQQDGVEVNSGSVF